MKNKLFFHIATLGRYQEKLDEACWALQRSGLLKALDEVVLRIHGQGDVRLDLDHGKVSITRDAAPGILSLGRLKAPQALVDQSLEAFWREVQGHCAQEPEEFNALFLSTRHACKDARAAEESRSLMLHHLVERWQERLAEAEPICWCRVEKLRGLEPLGAFWWARSSALRGAKDIAALLSKGRAIPADGASLYPVPADGPARERSDVLFTLPGKLGDNLARLPVARQYAAENNAPVDLCLNFDSRSLAPVLQEQAWVNRVLLSTAIKDFMVGGRPYDFGNPEEFKSYRQVYHLGYRSAPEEAHFTTHALIQSECPLTHRAIVGLPCLKLRRDDVKDLCVHLESSKAYMNEATKRMLLPIYADLCRVFRSIYFVGMGFDRKFYREFNAANAYFIKVNPLSMKRALGILSTSTVFCVDSSVRWLAYASGVEAVVPMFGNECSYHGERSPNETLANQPSDIYKSLLANYERHNGVKFLVHTRTGLIWGKDRQ